MSLLNIKHSQYSGWKVSELYLVAILVVEESLACQHFSEKETKNPPGPGHSSVFQRILHILTFYSNDSMPFYDQLMQKTNQLNGITFFFYQKLFLILVNNKNTAKKKKMKTGYVQKAIFAHYCFHTARHITYLK